MRALKVYGIGQKMLEAFVEAIRHNPDPLCINDRIFVSNQPVSPALVRSVRHKDFAKVFGKLGIYNLVLLPKQDNHYRFIAKLSNGNIHNVVVCCEDNGTHVSFTTAVGKALLNTIQNLRITSKIVPNTANTDDLVYEDMSMNIQQPVSKFMTFSEMPPGLADAIKATGITPMTKEQWEELGAQSTTAAIPQTPDTATSIHVITDVVDKTQKEA